jgi:Tol biopolymer transport system component
MADERRRSRARRLGAIGAVALVLAATGCERIERITNRTFQDGQRCTSPSISSDGTAIVYTDLEDPSYTSEDPQAALHDVDTGREHVFGTLRDQTSNQAVSADGDVAVFTRDVVVNGGLSGEGRTYVWKRSTGTATRLSPIGRDFFTAVLSDDGTHVVEVEQANKGIWISTVASGTNGPRTKITPDTGPNDSPYTAPQVSATGRYVAYMTLDGSAAHVTDTTTGITWSLLPPGAEMSGSPSISDDGRRVVYSATRPGVLSGAYQVYVWDRVTERTTRLTNRSDRHSGHPSISGDGSRVAFTRYDPSTGTNEILVMDRVEREVVASFSGNRLLWNPVLTRMGRRVVFCSAASDLAADSPAGAPNVYLWYED